ncbi:hypothetical protein G9A89_002136 [Geosiphon pyriformis]|nr:hypothetical protein G9A89_002136 [Geosiphon pyriformis]
MAQPIHIQEMSQIADSNQKVEQGSIAKGVYNAIVIFECLPRIANLFQIYHYTGGRLKFVEIMGVIFCRKEGYLLFGHKNITQKQVNRLSLVSDLICFAYPVFMAWALASNYGGISDSDDAQSKMRNLVLAALVTGFIMFGRFVVEAVKNAFGSKEEEPLQVATETPITSGSTTIPIQVNNPISGPEHNPPPAPFKGSYPIPGPGYHPFPGQGNHPFPNQGNHPFPNQGNHPFPNQGNHPFPGQGNHPFPNQGNHPFPNQGNHPLPGQEYYLPPVHFQNASGQQIQHMQPVIAPQYHETPSQFIPHNNTQPQNYGYNQPHPHTQY